MRLVYPSTTSLETGINHRDTEDAEVAQRVIFSAAPLRPLCLCGERRLLYTRLRSYRASLLLVFIAFCLFAVNATAQNAQPTPTPAERHPANPKLPTLFVVGDSTANNNANGAQGWGDPFAAFFDTAKINVLNRARAGRSSRTFLTEGLWDKVLADMKAGDFVLIQFGHNDAGAINDASRARGSLPGLGEETQEIDNQLTHKHEVVHTFGWYMRKFIADAKAKGAKPIVLSLTVRNIWKDGRVERGPGRYGEWSEEIAKSAGVPFVDLTNIVADRYEKFGEEKVKEFFGPDHTHTSPAGAELNAESVVAGLKGLKPCELCKYLSPKGKAVAAYKPAKANNKDKAK